MHYSLMDFTRNFNGLFIDGLHKTFNALFIDGLHKTFNELFID